MKQLLHTSTDGRHVVVALYDTVYYYDNHRTITGNGSLSAGIIHELVRASSPSSDRSTTHFDAAISDHLTDHNEAVITSISSAPNKSASSATVPELMEPHEVQAVAVTIVNTTVWCAVARYDKSLTLYCISSAESIENENKNTLKDSTIAMKIATPHTIHRTAKRVSSLSFATVYGATSDDPDLTVIVAGDVVGDANAYSLELQQNVAHDNVDDLDDNNNDDTHEQIITKHRRLLLGHTASMLTSVHVVKHTKENETENNHRSKHQLILTSDRDEKIRVSRFPESYCIEGYLLGHTAFVSAVAPIPTSSAAASIFQTCNLCVSVGGDCTIRLWNYSTCHELAVASTNFESSHDRTTTLNDENGAESGTNDPIEDNHETTEIEIEDNSSPTGPIPTKVAVTTDGTVIATIYDDCCSIDFWTIPSQNDEMSGNSNFVLHRSYRWNGPGQPLGIAFLDNEHFILVMQEPHFIQQFKIIITDNSTERTITNVVPIDSDACLNIQQSASERDIIMLEGLLEKDEYGCLKMGKMSERRGGATIQPWNNIARKETNAERIRRLRKRRRDERIQQRQQQQQVQQQEQSTTS